MNTLNRLGAAILARAQRWDLLLMLDIDIGSLLGQQTHSLESFGSEVHLDAIDGGKEGKEEVRDLLRRIMLGRTLALNGGECLQDHKQSFFKHSLCRARALDSGE